MTEPRTLPIVENPEKTQETDPNVPGNNPATDESATKTPEEVAKAEAEKKAADAETQLKLKHAKFAEERRKKEEEETKVRKIQEESYQKGLIDSVGGINPYTNEKIESQADVEEFLNMREAEKQGLDPITDYSKFLKNKKAKAKEEQKETKTKDDWYKKDLEDFQKEFPNVDYSKVIADDELNEFAEELIGTIPLKTIYKKFLGMKEKTELEITAKAEKLASEMYAKKMSSPGSVINENSNADSGFYTLEQIKAMTPTEVKKNFDKVQKSLKKLNIN